MNVNLLKLFLLAIGGSLVACSGGDSASSHNETDDSVSAAIPPSTTEATSVAANEVAEVQPGIKYGTLTLKYGDETAEITQFRVKHGGEVIIPKTGNVQLSLVGTSGEMFSINYPVKTGDPLIGNWVATKKQVDQPRGHVTLQKFIGQPLKGLSLREGKITVTQCDLDGNFVANFEGEGGSLVPPEVPLKPFSGTINVKVPVKRSGFE